MIKLLWFFLVIGIIGSAFVANIFLASETAMATIKQWFNSSNEFYKLVAHLFIIATHPIFRLFIAFGIMLMIIRVIFVVR
ncbi:hypothetical protein [Spiroplasma phoeniceum]|uniref:Spiroplasma plectrovirus-related protein n=1 Tax=Spiroplasma phoeniceum P40 TaxID=1276259 RepID=A0A345DP68_9MOLU|nr:hypothetical protein [Spiroplasma phoeniceum]AXF96006.1 spiroplasma plectrovirus-related protein [Spiroplasma phoeniceum P40]